MRIRTLVVLGMAAGCGPVDEDRLSSCLAEIRRTPCGSGIRNLADCNDEQLCTVAEEGTL